MRNLQPGTSLAKPGSKLFASQFDYILLDGSGSMSSKWWDTLAALQGFMSVLKTKNIHSHGLVHVFDSTDIELIQRNALISEWPSFIDEPLGLHGGGTPLYDAVNVMVRNLAKLDPQHCSIVIITDGQENGSMSTSADQARNLLDWCRAKGWQVTFLGADFSNSAQAKALGASEKNSLAIQGRKIKDAGQLLGEKRARHAQTGAEISFTGDEKQDFGGYLTGPSVSPWGQGGAPDRKQEH